MKIRAHALIIVPERFELSLSGPKPGVIGLYTIGLQNIYILTNQLIVMCLIMENEGVEIIDFSNECAFCGITENNLLDAKLHPIGKCYICDYCAIDLKNVLYKV